MSKSAPESVELAAMVCSRVCHDVVNPVGAIINGLEVLDENADASLREVAFDLIRKSATQASAKLQFARLVFGAASSAGATIDLREAEEVTRGFVDSDKIELTWAAYPGAPKKDQVKLLLNLVMIGIACIPRGGSLSVTVTEGDDAPSFLLKMQGRNARVPEDVKAFLTEASHPDVTSHNIQPYYARLIAELAGMKVVIGTPEDDTVTLTARAV